MCAVVADSIFSAEKVVCSITGGSGECELYDRMTVVQGHCTVWVGCQLGLSCTLLSRVALHDYDATCNPQTDVWPSNWSFMAPRPGGSVPLAITSWHLACLVSGVCPCCAWLIRCHTELLRLEAG